MTLSQLPETVSADEVSEAFTDLEQTPTGGLRRLSVGLLLVYVAILAINSGGMGILLPNLVSNLTRRTRSATWPSSPRWHSSPTSSRSRSPEPCRTPLGRVSVAGRPGWSAARWWRLAS